MHSCESESNLASYKLAPLHSTIRFLLERNPQKTFFLREIDLNIKFKTRLLLSII